MVILTPQPCPVCYTRFTPTVPLNYLFFYMKDPPRTDGPYVVCDPCMMVLHTKLEETKVGRYDNLVDETKRICFSLEPTFTLGEVQRIQNHAAQTRKFAQIHQASVLGELMMKAKRSCILRRPIPDDYTSEEDTSTSEVSSGSTCNRELAFPQA